MGMQCHFQVADLLDPEPHINVNSLLTLHEESGDDWNKYYIIVNENMHFNFDAEYKDAWFDIGQMHESAVVKMKWLIENRICFSCS